MKTLLKNIVLLCILSFLFLIIFDLSSYHINKTTRDRLTIPNPRPDSSKHPLKYINTNFENASQLDWEVDSAGIVNVRLIYDHERSSPNRANGHWHFQVEAERGSDVTLLLTNFDNIWNGMKAIPISHKTNCLISQDGKNWTSIPGDLIYGNQLKIQLHMESDKMYVASVEPYRISDLEQLISEIKKNPLVEISPVGKTVEGRPLEIIRVGDKDAPYIIFLRARAHSWEPGGNWVVQGLIRSLLQDDAASYLKRYCVYIMPMANKDGVARGRTRFNMLGKDLNREWNLPADAYYAPENYALETWLKEMVKKGKKPHLAIDLHNDRGGNLHISRPNVNLEPYLANMERFENLLYKHTWFTEGSTGKNFRNSGSIGEGLLERYGIDAFVYELNYEWIAGLNKVPFGKDWELLGKQLRDVFFDYFDEK